MTGPAVRRYCRVMDASEFLVLVSPSVALAVGIWGFRRSTRADRLRAYFELQQRYLDQEVRAGRRAIHQSISGQKTSSIAMLDDATLRSVGHAMAIMNSIAIAWTGKFVDPSLLEMSMGRSFASAVTAAKPYIDHVEQKRGFRPYPYAERLAAELLQKTTRPTGAGQSAQAVDKPKLDPHSEE